MKIAHVADCHLGFQRFAGARNRQRKKDVFEVFTQAILEIITKKTDVALFVGDIFDTPDPDNETMCIFLNAMRRLEDWGVEPIIVSGNHDTPKSDRAHIYAVLEEFGLRAVYKEVEHHEINGVTFACIPWDWTPTPWHEVEGADFLVYHAGAKESPGGARLTRVAPDPGEMDIRWDYIAMGDWHKHVEVYPNTWYPGALEHFTFGEEGEDCGFILVDDRGILQYFPVETREMRTIRIDLEELDDPDAEVSKLLEPYADACVRLQMSGRPELLDIRSIEWHPLLQKEFLGGTRSNEIQFIPEDVVTDWQHFCEEEDIDKAIRRYGNVYLRK
jgi:DNA repair exonuclease SbcCD nuclease subunit